MELEKLQVNMEVSFELLNELDLIVSGSIKTELLNISDYTLLYSAYEARENLYLLNLVLLFI